MSSLTNNNCVDHHSRRVHEIDPISRIKPTAQIVEDVESEAARARREAMEQRKQEAAAAKVSEQSDEQARLIFYLHMFCAHVHACAPVSICTRTRMYICELSSARTIRTIRS